MKRTGMGMFVLVWLLVCGLSGCFLSETQTVSNSLETKAAPITPVQPTDGEMETAYHKAAEAMCWFDMCTLDCGPIEETRELDGDTYLPVRHDTFKTLNDLKQYLQTLFSDAFIERLFNSGEFIPYRDIDGRLYAVDAARGTDPDLGESSYTVNRDSATKITFVVRAPLIDYETNETYNTVSVSEIYEYVGGKWVFTHFELIN